MIRPTTHGREKGGDIYRQGQAMLKPGDVGYIQYKEALGQPRRMRVTVLSEFEPGLYRCATDMGISVLVGTADFEPEAVDA